MEGEKVRRFQHLYKALNGKNFEGQALKEDNILGPRTRSCISKMPILRVGSRGTAVEFVQEVVKAEPVDVSFGPITERCVKSYQKSKDIQVDGIVGTQTWATIINS